jgi:hypothetical protein
MWTIVAQRVRLACSRAARFESQVTERLQLCKPLGAAPRRQLGSSDPPALIWEFFAGGGTVARAQGTKIVYIWRAKEG